MARARTITGSGRPRDPELERRVARAALTVFGRVGWPGFTLDAVAVEAGAGKASIYLRWPNKQAVLVDALHSYIGQVTDVDTGSLHGDLLELARQFLAFYLGDVGKAVLRLGPETRAVPELAEHFDTLWRSQVSTGREIVRRGIARGDVGPDTSATLLLDCLVGGVTNHILTTPPELEAAVAANADQYAADLVEFLLRSLSAPSPPHS
ncbi:transcriptional regulator, TetR family [Pseudonocardia ammonioxydans]|uniref:Transcriptional regulator, TetR family n=1 Tax=Pseudonocardia ammonioxydans TaxID=260086 RepID=A0A1I5H8U8_PSUAM|nr:TetR/AcrR family transcriptional regulator [Pseudonocardia ammonioxydans]SFO44702.1 transcriptional regulator, TetR family [Pseudonocardia ammonioxydans]